VPLLLSLRAAAAGQPVGLLPAKARGMRNGERINEEAVPTSLVCSRLGCRGRLPPPVPDDRKALRRPSDDWVAYHQPYQGRHTGRAEDTAPARGRQAPSGRALERCRHLVGSCRRSWLAPLATWSCTEATWPQTCEPGPGSLGLLVFASANSALYEEGPVVKGRASSLANGWGSSLYCLLMGGAGRWEAPAGPVQTRVVRRPERW
jgi:hypothetical protein